MAPKTAAAMAGFSVRTGTADSGFNAATMPGAAGMLIRPSTPMARNHTTITGPNSRPIRCVPWLWMANRPTRMPNVTGRMNAAKPGAASFNPSIADRTEIAGVMTPSP